MYRIPIALLVVIVGACGYFRFTDTSERMRQEIRNNPRVCPNSTQKARQPIPVPTAGLELWKVQESEAFAPVIALVNRNTTIRGQQIVSK